jgi:putative FmdB family regulatory protein
MPIYEYRCGECGYQKEFLQRINDAPLTDCPECGRRSFNKLMSAAGFQLKGTGWYATDFKNSGKKPAAKQEKTEAKQEKTEAKQEKTEAKQEKTEAKQDKSTEGPGKDTSKSEPPAAAAPARPAARAPRPPR